MPSIKENIFLLFLVVLILFVISITFCTSYGSELKVKPAIISYFWPVAKERNDFYHLDMETPNVIDILSSPGHGSQDVKDYWQSRGKIILHRVYPMRYITNEVSLYNYFKREIEHANGISVDEITKGISIKELEIFCNVLKLVRNDFPQKYIVVWSTSQWNSKRASFLQKIRDRCNIFIPELYFSEEYSLKNGLQEIKERIEKLEKQAPGIIDKIVPGIGVYPKMDNLKEISIRDHMKAQIEYIKSDPLLKSLSGLAIYAPCYLSEEDRVYLDEIIKQYYF